MNRVLVIALVACHHPAPASKTASCADVAAHVQQLLEPTPKPAPKPDAKPDPAADRPKHIHDIFVTRCTTDRWPQAALTCMENTASLHDGHHCKDQLSIDQRRTFDADLDAFDRDASLARLPAQCVEYKRLTEKLGACDKLPQQTRDMMKQQFDITIKEQLDAPGDMRGALELKCRSEAEQLRQTLTAFSCAT